MKLVMREKPDAGRVESFHALPIGARFIDGVCRFSGYNAGTFGWHVWEKVDKSHAVCREQWGYGNTRFVGVRNPFAPFARVSVVE